MFIGERDCGGYFHIERSKTIQSKNYSSNYENNLDCYYIISAEEEYYPQIEFVDIILPTGDKFEVSGRLFDF